MWIKFGTEIMQSAVMKRCATALKKGDCAGASRQLICITIFVASAEDMTWQNAAELAKMTGYPVKSCDIVWKICLDENVLRPLPNGRYSALGWLREKKYVGSSDRLGIPPVPPVPGAYQRQPETQSITAFQMPV